MTSNKQVSNKQADTDTEKKPADDTANDTLDNSKSHVNNGANDSNSANGANGKKLVTIKFRNAGKQYDFDTADLNLAMHDEVVVETNKGRALGKVVRTSRFVADKQLPSDLKRVLRLATEADLNMARISASKEEEAYEYCQKRISQRKMAMKLVKAEYLFDGSKIIFYFTADGRIDFRELVKDLAQYFHTRIEMRQIGVRDEAKLLGGIGICGRELCCGTFLTDFNPVSVRMAKQQGLALNPTKISGQCGRLLCCLGYEYDNYCNMAKQLPRPGSKFTLEGKTVEVIATQTLSQTVTIRCEGTITTSITVEQLTTGKLPADSGSGKSGSAQAEQTTRHDAGNNKTKAVTSSTAKEDSSRPDLATHKAKKNNERRRQRPKRSSGSVEKSEESNRPGNKPGSKQVNRERVPAGTEKESQGSPKRNPRNKKQTERKQGAAANQQRRNKSAVKGQEEQNRGDTRNNNRSQPGKKNTQNSNRDSAKPTVKADNNTDNNTQTKPGKRRNRNRRRPTRKP